MSSSLALGSLVLLAIVLHLIALRPGAGTWGFWSGLLLLSGHSTFRGNSEAAIGLRFGGLVVAVAFVLVSLRRAGKSQAGALAPDAPTRPGPPADIRMLLLAGTLLYGLATVMDDFAPLTVVTGLAFVVAVLTLAGINRSGQAAQFVNGYAAATMATLVVSLVLMLARPSVALVGGRLQGFFVSANTLGFFAALWLLHAMTTRRLGPRTALLSVLPLAALVLSGNRSSAAALATAFLVFVFMVLHTADAARARRLVVLAAIAGTVAYLWAWDTMSALLRTNNSRQGGLDYALHDSDLKWLGGMGYNQSPVELASTPLRWLAEEGRIAALLCLLTYAVVLLVGQHAGASVTACAVFGIFSSLFEGWYFAGVSALFVSFWLVVLAAHNTTADAVRVGAALSPADTGDERDRPGDPRRGSALPGTAQPRARVGRGRNHAPALLRR